MSGIPRPHQQPRSPQALTSSLLTFPTMRLSARCLSIALLLPILCNAQAPTTESLAPTHTIKLPVPWSRGYWWSAHSRSAWIFAMSVEPDHSVLAFEADKNGKWPLIRVRDWWSDHPKSETITIPGWSASDAANLEYLGTDLQLTPDGHYAVAFSIARWQSPSHEKTAPAQKARPADTLITVVDLQTFKIVSSVHSLALYLTSPDAQRIISNQALALRGTDYASGNAGHVFRLLSLPNLTPGQQCTAGSLLNPEGFKKEAEGAKATTDLNRGTEACRGVLNDGKATSLFNFDSLVTTGQPPVPRSDVVAFESSYLPGPHDA